MGPGTLLGSVVVAGAATATRDGELMTGEAVTRPMAARRVMMTVNMLE